MAEKPRGHDVGRDSWNLEVDRNPRARADPAVVSDLMAGVLVKMRCDPGRPSRSTRFSSNGADEVRTREAVRHLHRAKGVNHRVEDVRAERLERPPGRRLQGRVLHWNGLQPSAIALSMPEEGVAAVDEVAEAEVPPARRVEVGEHQLLFTAWPGIVNGDLGGKRMPGAVYLHRRALPPEVEAAVVRLAASVRCTLFEVIKFRVDSHQMSFLHYPSFDTAPFPFLLGSFIVDLDTGTAQERRYSPELAPVLHRKELTLPPGDSRYRDWASLTLQAEDAGLFDNPSEIGTRPGWERTLAAAGMRVDGHALVRTSPGVLRHRTALVRYALSTPMEALRQHGFLDGKRRIFDYGCGRGGDLTQLRQLGVSAAGWDPHFAPSAPLQPADIVNLGFVLNVIESQPERAEALRGAWGLTGVLMVVGVLIGGRSAWEKHRLFRDGVVTSKGTFQKYFSQDELRAYLELHTGRRPIALAPGLFFVFRDDEDEQAFLAERQRSHRPIRPSLVRPPKEQRPARPARVPRESRPTRDRWEPFREVIEAYWLRCIDLGRPPEPPEFEREVEIRAAGSAARVLAHCMERFGDAPLMNARRRRMSDLLVWMALAAFERRQSSQKLPQGLRTDIRIFWGGWSKAQDAAKELLFSAGDRDTLLRAAGEADAAGHGVLEGNHALFVRGGAVSSLPAVLRVYVGCAGLLAGAPEAADLLKVHLQGGKLTLMNYDDFSRPIPDLVERVKVDLRRAGIQFFSYDSPQFAPQPLLRKARLLAIDDPDRQRCERLETQLVKHGFDLDEFLDRPTFELRLASKGLVQRGWVIRKSSGSPP
jgi:DNA phosphorothioation-associated putative methyltransferase